MIIIAALLLNFETPVDVYGQSYVTSGSIVGVQAAPNNTSFLNTIGTGGVNFKPIKATRIQFELGSPDNYNAFDVISNNSVIYSKTLNGTGNWSVVDLVSVDWLSPVTVTGLRFHSSKPAMEVDNIQIFGSNVPEPATWAMMVLGFGLVGMSSRRGKIKMDLG